MKLGSGRDRDRMHRNLSKALLSSLTKSTTLPDESGGVFFADVKGPFEAESLSV